MLDKDAIVDALVETCHPELVDNKDVDIDIKESNDYDIKVDGEEHAYASGAIRYNKDKGDFNLIPSRVVNHMIDYIVGQYPRDYNYDALGFHDFYMKSLFNKEYENSIVLITMMEYLIPMDALVMDESFTDSKSYGDYQVTHILDAFAHMLRDLAIHYQKGARKYGVDNWKKGCQDGTGIPESSFFDSGVRHSLQYLNGEDDEPHHISAIWNFFGAIYLRDRMWE